MQEGVEYELFDEIELHCLIEERTIYPALRSGPDAEIRAQSDVSYQHHEELEQAVAEARKLMSAPRNSELREAIDTVRSLFEIHVLEEEGELFAIAEKTLGVKALGQMVEVAREIREDFLAEDQRASHRPEIVQNPRGGEQMRKVV